MIYSDVIVILLKAATAIEQLQAQNALLREGRESDLKAAKSLAERIEQLQARVLKLHDKLVATAGELGKETQRAVQAEARLAETYRLGYRDAESGWVYGASFDAARRKEEA